MRIRFAFLGLILVVLLVSIVWYLQSKKNVKPAASSHESPSVTLEAPPGAAGESAASASLPTSVYAHNVLLRKGPNFRIYVRWLHGQIGRTQRNVTPSFDNLGSFFLDVKTGVVRANIGDLGNFLNKSGVQNSPLKNIELKGSNGQLRLTGTLHKIVPLPIEMVGNISALPQNRIQVHVTKLSVLKIPLKGLLGDFHVKIDDLFHPKGIPGIEVSGNDIFLDTQQLLPPPHIRGPLTTVRIAGPDIEEIYGNAENDVTRVEQWRNFLQLRDGSIDFGKLTMHHVDLIMIDISKDAWFDLDLANYQAQLVNGYTRMTPQAGLQIFMPDVDELPHTKANQNISIEWLRNRNLPPPADITSKK